VIYTLTRDGCDEQKEGICDGLIDVPGVLIEPPPRRAGLGQLAELLLERREAGLVVGHGVLGEMGWALASCSAAGSPYVPVGCSDFDRCAGGFECSVGYSARQTATRRC
jgi:hypothetical protein